MVYNTPPILPHRRPGQPDVLPAPTEPLHVSFDVNLLEPYLPPPRTEFLTEELPGSDASKSTSAKLPHVTLTYASSLDSQISLGPGIQTILSGPETKAMTHYLRTRHDAIMVGANTARVDNPSLTSRYAEGEEVVGLERQPRPFILDQHMQWEPSEILKVFHLAKEGTGRAPWWITQRPSSDADARYEEKFKVVRDYGGEVLLTNGKKDWGELLTMMAEHGIRSVMIEGGAAVINNLLEAKNQQYVSSVVVTIAPTYLGKGGVAVSPSRTGPGNEARLKDVRWVPMGQDVVMAGRLEP